MKVLLLLRKLDFGGAQRQLVHLAKGLARNGHAVVVVTCYRGGEFEPELMEGGVSVRCLEKNGRWDLFACFLRLRRIVQSERPDIVQSFLGDGNIFSALLRLSRIPSLYVWGIRASWMDLGKYDWAHGAGARVEAALSGCAHLIIANSRTGKSDAVQRGFPERRVVVIPNGIDTERFRPDPEAGKAIRARLQVPVGCKLIGRVGRIDPMKDIPAFLKAAALLSENRDYIRFVSVGGGNPDYVSSLQRMARDLGVGPRVIWPGAMQDTPGIYNALDLHCCTSCFGEGFPNVVGESMACGTPCVVTDVGDCAEIVGAVGCVVPARDQRRIADGCIRLLSQRPEASEVRDRIVSKFSLQLMIERTSEALANLRLMRCGKRV